MNSFWYEQSPVLATGEIGGDVYKHEGEFVRDGQWHRLNPASRAMYRVIPGHLQVVFRGEKLESTGTDADMSQILAAVEVAGPLTRYENDRPEVLIRPLEGGGFEMTSHWTFLKTGATFRDFTPEQWNDAYNRLCNLESKQD